MDRRDPDHTRELLPSSHPLLRDLLGASVVAAADWAALRPDARDGIGRCPDPRRQLALLAEHGLLTAYQVGRIEAGDWDRLILGNYRILDQIGAGGMGVVFRAEHRLMRRPVAVKVLTRTTDPDDVLLRRFFAEIQMVSQLQHPNIACALDAGEAPGRHADAGRTYYFVMEYVPGADLDAHIRANGPLAVDRACHLVHQLADALAEAHRLNLVHRDVKPSNVRITPDGQVKLLDFGLGLCQENRITQAGTPMGTPEYMAPEQVTDAAAADARTDVYGLGGVLFWCLTGRPPFPPMGSLLLTLFARSTQPPPSARQVRPELPPALDAVIARAMATDPAGRYPTAAALMRALVPFVAAERPRDGSPPRAAAERRHRVLIADDEPLVRESCRFALELAGLDCDEVGNGAEAVAAVHAEPYDLLLLDIDMPEMDGPEVCRRIRSEARYAHLKVLIMSGRATSDRLAGLLAAGADDYLAKPFSVVQLQSRVQAAVRLRDAQERSDLVTRHLTAVNAELERGLTGREDDLLEARSALILAMARLVAYRDNDTGGHVLRLPRFTRCLAEAAASVPAFAPHLGPDAIELIVAASPLHDIGKVGIPDRVLLNPGRLDPDERRLMETHTVIGHQVLTDVAREHGFALALLHTAAEIARGHHERYDGSGYPDGLAGDDIPLSARLVAFSDVYDALRSKRLYKPAFSHAAAVQTMAEHSPGHFDPGLMAVFRTCSKKFDAIYNRETS